MKCEVFEEVQRTKKAEVLETRRLKAELTAVQEFKTSGMLESAILDREGPFSERVEVQTQVKLAQERKEG